MPRTGKIMSDDPNAPTAWMGLIASNNELESLKGNNDPVSRERIAALTDQLIAWDMAMGPARRAMGGGGKRKLH